MKDACSFSLSLFVLLYFIFVENKAADVTYVNKNNIEFLG